LRGPTRLGSITGILGWPTPSELRPRCRYVGNPAGLSWPCTWQWSFGQGWKLAESTSTTRGCVIRTTRRGTFRVSTRAILHGAAPLPLLWSTKLGCMVCNPASTQATASRQHRSTMQHPLG